MHKKATLNRTFVSPGIASTELGLPESWLRSSAEANLIPAILVGNRWLIHLERTRIKLTELAEQAGEVPNE